jgi:hypothetical protein
MYRPIVTRTLEYFTIHYSPLRSETVSLHEQCADQTTAVSLAVKRGSFSLPYGYTRRKCIGSTRVFYEHKLHGLSATHNLNEQQSLIV